jgi:hypothetical protein
MKKGSALMHTSRLSRSLHAHLLALASTLVALGVPCIAPPAHASTGTITVGLLGIDGANAPAETGPAITEALRRAIPKFSSVRIEMSQQDPVEVKLVFGCTDEKPDCMAKVGKSLSVGRLIYGSLRKQQGTGVYTVTLKQLNVADATVEKFITETVPLTLLTAGNPELDTLVEKWLRELLIDGLRGSLRITSEPPSATVQLDGVAVGVTPLSLNELEVGDHVVKLELPGHTSMVRPVTIRGGLIHELTAQLQPRRLVSTGRGESGEHHPTNWSRGLRYTSYVFYGLAAVSTLAAVGTWRSYVANEDRANVYLNQLESDLRGSGTLGNYRDFLGSSAQLSSCAAQPGLASSTSYQGYLSECQSGNSLARATTGLWITTASLVALGITSTIISAIIKRPEPKPRHPDKQPAPRSEPVEITPPPAPVHLDGVAPVVTPTGAGAVLSLSF